MHGMAHGQRFRIRDAVDQPLRKARPLILHPKMASTHVL